MRGKLGANLYDKVIQRITPAHAGKTPTAHQALPRESDHPRACGENLFTNFTTTYDSGSPPRMRGKLLALCLTVLLNRITPAHAGKTLSIKPATSPPTDHPRACGENRCAGMDERLCVGSPPRMRGKHYVHCPVLEERRITPAHAGKTSKNIMNQMSTPDHPRACGENAADAAGESVNGGSPPRMRGKRTP